MKIARRRSVVAPGWFMVGFSLRRWAFAWATWDRAAEDFRVRIVPGFNDYFVEESR